MIRYSVGSIDIMVINHVDVSSWGIHCRGYALNL